MEKRKVNKVRDGFHLAWPQCCSVVPPNRAKNRKWGGKGGVGGGGGNGEIAR